MGKFKDGGAGSDRPTLDSVDVLRRCAARPEFGKPFPDDSFWTVPELRAAWSHLIGPGRHHLGRLADTALHRGPRTALGSGDFCNFFHYGYFRAFLRELCGGNNRRQDRRDCPLRPCSINEQ